MLKISGASDDVVTLNGDIDEEINYLPYDEGGVFVALSSGHVFKVQFADTTTDGRWEISLVAGWDRRFSVDRDGADGDDTATIDADVSWAMAGQHLNLARSRA